MCFHPIDLEHWPRREYYEHFRFDTPCTYSMTVSLDITHLVANGHRLYPAMLYSLSSIVNRHAEFRTALDQEGRIGIYDELHPCYTIFHKDTQTFSNLWTAYTPSYPAFCDAYAEDLQNYGTVHQMMAKPDIPANNFPVSMIPWASFNGFNLNLQKGYAYLLPIFTMGKYTRQGERCLLPLAVQVHHAVCDGFHVSRFLEDLQALLDTL